MFYRPNISAVTLLLVGAATSTAVSVSGQLALADFEDGLTGPFFGADAFTGSSSTPGAAKPRLTVADDSAGLGSGNALFVESAGSGAELTAFLSSPITIGPNLGDGIALEFDWRLNGSAAAQGLAPDVGDFRFGFFSDADGDIGQTFGTISTYDESNVLISEDPAVFGSTNGDFDASSGPIADDFGVHVRTDFNRFSADPNALPTSASDNVFQNVRVRTETQGDTSGIHSGGGETFVNGSFDIDEGAPEDLIAGGTNYGELREGNANTLRLELIRGDNGVEEIVIARYTITNALGTTVLESSRDEFTDLTETTFHYVSFENQSGDFDYVLDNVRVFNLPEAVGLEGDYNGDGFVSQGDLDLVLLNWGDAVAPGGFDEANIPGGGPFDGLMSQNELDGVLLNWGDGTPPTTTIPEPTTGLALLGLGALALVTRRRG